MPRLDQRRPSRSTTKQALDASTAIQDDLDLFNDADLGNVQRTGLLYKTGLPYALAFEIPKLDIEAILAAAALASDRSSIFRLEDSTDDRGPSITFVVIPDPDAVKAPTEEQEAVEGAVGLQARRLSAARQRKVVLPAIAHWRVGHATG